MSPPETTEVKTWEVRTEEQPYAFMSDKTVEEENVYGQKIDLIELMNRSAPVNRSIDINQNSTVGDNPNRNKQHGFYFTADNCIGCHACESACAEKNDTPAHLAFRSVGYVEGGEYPDYLRLNISMACNHCDDPVCLKGCPTGAYTKLAEYGAVLQDPDTCFGCGYCTWVCPYNAPQLDPVKGEVSKCNMCVDRLEVGLKPACVSACLGNALDFGVIENIPENRTEAATQLPGFPDPSITHPNVRFQQVKALPEEMSRTDSSPIKYKRSAKSIYRPVIDQKQGKKKYWNLPRLNSHENPLVAFTLVTQASIGLFILTFGGVQLEISALALFGSSIFYPIALLISLVLVSLGLFMSTLHLGKPLRFYRGFNNLKYSPVCREGLGIAVYMGMLGLCLLATTFSNSQFQAFLSPFVDSSIEQWNDMFRSLAFGFGCLAVPSAIAGLYYMNRCYRIKARPFWDHWQVLTSFLGNSISLGAILLGIVTLPVQFYTTLSVDQNLMLIVAAVLCGGLAIEGIGLLGHYRDLTASDGEGGAAFYVQLTTFGRTYQMRNFLLVLGFVMSFVVILNVSFLQLSTATDLFLLSLAAVVTLATSFIGRALFYILVIPTTMPGAFFWRNKAFEKHAIDTGLAAMPQVGVMAPH